MKMAMHVHSGAHFFVGFSFFGRVSQDLLFIGAIRYEQASVATCESEMKMRKVWRQRLPLIINKEGARFAAFPPL